MKVWVKNGDGMALPVISQLVSYIGLAVLVVVEIDAEFLARLIDDRQAQAHEIECVFDLAEQTPMPLWLAVERTSPAPISVIGIIVRRTGFEVRKSMLVPQVHESLHDEISKTVSVELEKLSSVMEPDCK